jgi:uncharacterized membrane protein
MAHGALALCALGLVLSGTRSIPGGLGLAVVVLAPLALTARGLLAERRYTLQLLLIVLVAYIGGGIVELVAARGRWLAALAFTIACSEFGLVLTMLRRSSRLAPRESAESSNDAA